MAILSPNFNLSYYCTPSLSSLIPPSSLYTIPASSSSSLSFPLSSFNNGLKRQSSCQLVLGIRRKRAPQHSCRTYWSRQLLSTITQADGTATSSHRGERNRTKDSILTLLPSPTTTQIPPHHNHSQSLLGICIPDWHAP